MPTSNLITKSLGSVLQESGNGSPNHVSPLGSTYVDISTAIKYINIDGGSSWVDLNVNAYGNMYLTTGVAITPVINTWYTLSGSTWTGNTSNNGVSFSASTKTLSSDTGKGGKYLIFATGRFLRSVGGNTNFQLGISKNNATPENGFFQGCSVGGAETSSSVSLVGQINLTDGDTIQLSARNILNTAAFTIADSSLTLVKIGNL